MGDVWIDILVDSYVGGVLLCVHAYETLLGFQSSWFVGVAAGCYYEW